MELILSTALRIIQITDGSQPLIAGHKSSVGRGGYRIDASRNLWDGSGLKMDCASTDVAWARGGRRTFVTSACLTFLRCTVFNTKVLTSARNGEVFMWDVNKSGTGKYGEYICNSPVIVWLNNTGPRKEVKGSYSFYQRHCGFTCRAPLLHNWFSRRGHARMGECFSAPSIILSSTVFRTFATCHDP